MAEEYKTMEGDRFRSALTAWDTSRSLDWDRPGEFPEAKFLDEIHTQRFIQAILDKPDWKTKLSDASIREKWKMEAKEQQGRFRDEMFEYAVKELERYAANAADETNGIQPSGVDMVWRSDNLVDVELGETFKSLVEELEASQADEKDWHPGSKEQVLNIVHPSLYCVIYGKTKDKDGKIIPPPDVPSAVRINSRNNELGNIWSTKFQWLPAEFVVKKSGQVIIDSYINSLHPDTGLYLVIAKIFEKVVPLFNVVLTDLRVHPSRMRLLLQIRQKQMRVHPSRMRFPLPDKPLPRGYWWDSFDEIPAEMVDQLREKLAKEWSCPIEYVYNWDIGKEWRKDKGPKPCCVPDFDPAHFKCDEEQRVNLKGHRLQVIVKIGAIHLTPEKPVFNGGNWHIEGMANEKIVATCIYYYDSENIMGDRLDFRRAVDLSIGIFKQDDEEGAEQMFGISRDEAMQQDAGRVHTPQGRVLVFPNIYQHSVSSFHLVDPSKPGHRKILVFFLVDPTSRIISSADVPTQGPLWITQSMANTLNEWFPAELIDLINNEMGMSPEEAKKYRLELMEERSFAKDAVTEQIYERPFNLCEH